MAIWTTKEGKELEIKDMSNSHLINTIRYIKRRLDEYHDEDGGSYPCFQGEMAQIIAEQEYERAEEAAFKMGELRQEMIQEAKNRGLTPHE